MSKVDNIERNKELDHEKDSKEQSSLSNSKLFGKGTMSEVKSSCTVDNYLERIFEKQLDTFIEDIGEKLSKESINAGPINKNKKQIKGERKKEDTVTKNEVGHPGILKYPKKHPIHKDHKSNIVYRNVKYAEDTNFIEDYSHVKCADDKWRKLTQHEHYCVQYSISMALE